MNSFIENVNYVAGLDNLYGSGIELYKNNLSLKSVQHDIELKFSYYNNDDKKIHSIVHSEPGVLVGGINDVLLSFKSIIDAAITGSEFTCTVSSGVQNFVVNNVVMISIAIDSHNDTYKAYELEAKVTTAGAVTYDVFGEVSDTLKILPSLAMITSSDINAIANVYEIQDEVITVSENIVNVETVSDSIANVNITGTNIANVNIVGDDIANVNTVSAHISNVDTVSQSITDVNTVSDSIVDVGIVSTNIASINTVANAQNLADIIRVADDLNSMDINGIADITIVANDLVLGTDSNIITVSDSIVNVNTVSDSINNVNTVGTNITDVSTVSTNIANVNITATDIASVNNVSSNIADVNTVSDGIANVNTVSGSIANVNTVASNIVGLNSIVSNMPEILLADYNAAIATTKALESSDSAESSLQSALDSAASAALFPNHIADTTNPHEVTKSQVGLEFSENTADIDKVVASAGKLTSPVNISLSGDVSGSVSFDGSNNVNIATTIAANSIVLGTDTTGNYVAGNTAGTGISITGTAGEGWSPTIALTNVGAAGTYRSVTTDSKGRITAGTNPTTVSGYGLTDVYTITEVNNSLALKINNSEKGAANGVSTLDVNGKVVLTQIPDSILGQLEYVGTWNFTTMPTATQKGQYWIANVSGNGYLVGDWAVWNGVAFDKVDNTDAVASVAGRTGNVVLTKADVGLGNVDNTSDINKPISTATQNALNTKVDTTTNQTIAGVKTFSSTISGSISGNAATATTLATARTINGVSFDGTANIVAPTNLTVGTITTTAVPIESSTGTNASIPAATTALAGVMSSEDKVKLDGIAVGAQVNVATNLGITAGTTAGPIVTSSTGTNATLPTASASASGVVTTGNQTWAGVKTFSSNPISSAAQSTATNALTRKDYVDNALASKANQSTTYTKTEIDSVNLLRADKYLAAQAVANMVYSVEGKLSKVQYNNATDVDYEVLTYNGSGKLSNVAHYTTSILRGNTVLSYSAGKLVSAIYTGV